MGIKLLVWTRTVPDTMGRMELGRDFALSRSFTQGQMAFESTASSRVFMTHNFLPSGYGPCVSQGE